MAKWAKCDECGAEVYFDALITYEGELVNSFETAWCPKCEDEIKYRYSIVDGPAPVED